MGDDFSGKLSVPNSPAVATLTPRSWDSMTRMLPMMNSNDGLPQQDCSFPETTTTDEQLLSLSKRTVEHPNMSNICSATKKVPTAPSLAVSVLTTTLPCVTHQRLAHQQQPEEYNRPTSTTAIASTTLFSSNNDPRPTLYHVKRTISSPIVQTLVELGRANSTIRVQEITFADLKTPEYLRINPMGTSPAYCDGDVVIWESGAILDYLLEMYDPQYQYGCSPLNNNNILRAKYLHLKQYLIATVYPMVAAWFLRTLAATTTATADDRAKDIFRNVIGPYLTKSLGDGLYFLGDQFSVLDMIAAKPFTNLHTMGELAQFPALQAHWDRVSSRPSYLQAYEGMKIDPIIWDVYSNVVVKKHRWTTPPPIATAQSIRS